MPRLKTSLGTRSGAASPFSSAQRRKPGTREVRKDDESERLEDVGLVPTLAQPRAPQDVVGLMRHVHDSVFEDVPDRSAGMNSTRIAEVLRYRQALPPIVSIAHLHAISKSTTQTERELAMLIAQGKVRKVTIPGRGKGGAAVGEGVVTVDDWKKRLLEDSTLEEVVKDKYIELMSAYPTSATVPVSGFTQSQVQSLVAAGFLTNPAALSSQLGSLFARPTGYALSDIAGAGSSAITGTLAAVGGRGAIHDSGGSGSTLATRDNRPSQFRTEQREMTLALPSTGSYLKLLTAARLHLLYLLKQLSPRYKEATKEFLEEKWNGNTPADAVSVAKRMRGEFTGVLPGKTKRWRDFYGLEFEWVLAECIGSGLVELFNTGSVGIAVRAR